jgi:hypothetical protein
MKTKLTLLLFILLLFSCGTKNKNYDQPTEIESVEHLDQDADGVIDFIEVEPDVAEELVVQESQEISIPDEVRTGSSNTIHHPNREASTRVNIPAPIIEIKPRVNVPKYEMGKFVYEIPNEMVKLETYTVRARISRSLVDVKIYKDIVPVMDTIIRTSKTMQVELIDPSGHNFKIVSQSAKQFIEIDEPTEWVFFVTPLKYGESKLSIVVSIIKDGNLKQTVYSDDVIVETTTWLEIKLWLGNHWQWFIVVLIIPLIKWLHTRYIKNKNNNEYNK